MPFATLAGVAPVGNDCLIVTANDGRAALVKLDLLGNKKPAGFDQLVSELGDSDYRVRENASLRLAAMGEQIQPLLQQALEKTTDPEVRNRLEQALAQIAAHGSLGLPLGGSRITRVLRTLSASNGASTFVALAHEESANTDKQQFRTQEAALKLLHIDSRGTIQTASMNRDGVPEIGSRSWQTATWV